jgi:mannose-1-phosphate guanylyltransferase
VFGVPFATRMFARSMMVGLPKKVRRGGATAVDAATTAEPRDGKHALSGGASETPRRNIGAIDGVPAALAGRLSTPTLDAYDGATLRRLRSVVLLAGAVRPMPLASATGRSILDLPLDGDGRTILRQWIEHTGALARVAGLPNLPIRAMVNGNSPDPIGAVAASHLVRVERDFGEFRGTGGLLRDLARDYEDDDVILVANAFQLLIDPLADVARAMGRLGGEVGLVAHQDGTPSGVMLVTCKALRLISEAGYVDMKEQALPQIASRYDVTVLHRRRPTGLPVRTLSDYVTALRTYHRRRGGRPAITTDPLAEDWRPTFSIVEEGAVVDPLASVNDSVVLRGGRVEAGAVVVRSVVCPRGVVRREDTAVDQFITAPAAAGRAA